MGLYEVPLYVSLLDRDYVSQLPCVRYYVFVKISFKHTREECESKRAYVFGETIRNMFRCVCYFVVECDEVVVSEVGGALLDRPCMFFHIMCVVCMWSQ